MLDLAHTTCVFINGDDKNTEKYFYLIKNLQNQIKFHKIIYFTCGQFIEANNVNVKINKLNYIEFNNFCIKVVPFFIESNFALYAQTDGYPLNPHLWLEDFLHYDYIGAPWPSHVIKPEFNDETVGGYPFGGNGGFSLRSKRFLQLSSQLEYTHSLNEDEYVCKEKLKWFQENQIQFSVPSVGKKFSQESEWPNHHNDLNQVFGFHNRYRVDEAHEIFKKNFVLNESF